MRWRIPSGWRWTTVGEIADIVGGGTPTASDPTNFDEAGVPWITPADLSGYSGTYIERGSRSLSQKGYERSGARLMPSRAVLFSSRAPIGYCVIARQPVTTNQGFKSLVLKDRVLPEYARHYLLGSKRYVEDLASGTTFKEISGRRMAEVEVPIAPLDEQHRIVAAIETHFSRLDAAVASLTRAKANVKRARASVLKAAVEGRLVPTEAALARAQGRDYEPAAVLLDRILAERKAAWAASGARGKYAEPVKPETEGLPGLPEGWCWATVDSLTVGGFTNGLYVPKSQYGDGVPILRIDDFQDDWSRSAAELRLVDIDEGTQSKYGLATGQLVINRVNSLTHLGKCLAVEDRHLPAVFESNMMRATIHDGCLVDYLAVWLRSQPGRTLLLKDAKWAVNQASINQGDVGRTAVPLPPLAEQHRIVAEVDRRLSVLDALDATLDANLARCDRLRQAVLKRAFEGRLVPAEANAPQPAAAPQVPLLAQGARA